MMSIVHFKEPSPLQRTQLLLNPPKDVFATLTYDIVNDIGYEIICQAYHIAYYYDKDMIS
jgi:hypothetical protein